MSLIKNTSTQIWSQL